MALCARAAEAPNDRTATEIDIKWPKVSGDLWGRVTVDSDLGGGGQTGVQPKLSAPSSVRDSHLIGLYPVRTPLT